MVKIGDYNKLEVVKSLDFGMYLDGKELGEILLPLKYIPEGSEVGDELEVFLYLDSEDRLIATTLKPYATVGEFACLEVVSENKVGAFLDWGLAKDLLVPFREQRAEMRPGGWYIVYVYYDQESGRIAASAKLDKFLNNTPVEYEFNEEVDLMVVQETDLGYKVIVNNQHSGLLYHNEVFIDDIRKGDLLTGYVKHIRADEKLDISLQKQGYVAVDDVSQRILDALNRVGGKLPLSDKSSADDILKAFNCSKKSFKKAIGALYKSKLITITPTSIELVKR